MILLFLKSSLPARGGGKAPVTAALSLFLALTIGAGPVRAMDLPFLGNWIQPGQEFNFVFDFRDNPIKVRVACAAQNRYEGAVVLDHFMIESRDISTRLDFSLESVSDEGTGSFWKGALSSRYTLADLKPVGEISAQFEISNNLLTVKSLSIGNIFASGQMALAFPFIFDFAVRLNGVELKDFVYAFSGAGQVKAAGLVDGGIRVYGMPGAVRLKGKARVGDGMLDDFLFQQISLDFEGVYPVVVLSNSRIIKADGMVFDVGGTMDLSQRGSLSQQMAHLNLEPVIKRKGGELEWVLKSMRSQDGSGTTELKYLRKKTLDINSFSDTEESMLGVEHKLEF